MDATLMIADIPSPERDAMERFFLRCGFNVETACDGLDCLTRLRSLEPDVLVVDSELPWGGASAVVAFLNETHFEYEIPAIMVVGTETQAVLSEQTGVPSLSCFRKPVRMEALLDQVGLAVALMDLRRNEQSRRHCCEPARRLEKETCHV